MRLFCKKILPIFMILIFMLSGCKKEVAVAEPQESSTVSETVQLTHSFTPNEAASFESGSAMVVSLSSQFDNLSVSATFNSETITLNIEETQESELEELFTYSGFFTLPETESDTDMGVIEFVCEKDGVKESHQSGNITVLAKEKPAESKPATPKPQAPVVKKNIIAEVVYPAETFNGDTVDDTSRPYNSYLPVGTVDMCGSAAIVNNRIGKSYRLLRSGKRVYEKAVKVYEGTLPETNTLSVDRIGTEGKYTVLSLFTDWKAPFNLELKDQTYVGGKNNWKVDSANFTYVEIEFMYCNQFDSELTIPEDNPLFSSCEISVGEKSTVLKLHLKKTGGFYGFKAEYDEYDCLVLKFLEPSPIQQEENEYGYALYNKTIVIDAGHGGRDPGAIGINNAYESHLNLALANLIRAELQSIGANVIMIRSDDTEVTSDQRMLKLYGIDADFMISVHRDSGSSYGYESFYYNAFSAPASKFVHDRVAETGLYRQTNGSLWHYFYLNRVGVCPSVLTENGFVSNSSDLTDMYNTEHQTACAKATVRGIIDYFLYQLK
ncbi:MAG: N-acetylmuramoyl-L-alanine amidase [Acutalibacteraceae bacterium]|nr:N-acetylmuramoyl-L-alanine amidase [Acutalibacteraceae bacterium]